MKLPAMSASRSSSFFPASHRVAEAGGLQPQTWQEADAFWECIQEQCYDGNVGITNHYRFHFQSLCPNGDRDCFVRNAKWISENLLPHVGMGMLNDCWPTT
jgi:hypothetical protein